MKIGTRYSLVARGNGMQKTPSASTERQLPAVSPAVTEGRALLVPHARPIRSAGALYTPPGPAAGSVDTPAKGRIVDLYA